MELNCKIESDLKTLESYNDKYNWIPGVDNIRPHKRNRDLKSQFFKEIEAFYNSMLDYILSEIFSFESYFNDKGKLKVTYIEPK